MKKYILLVSIVTGALIISGCTNNKNINKAMNNESAVSGEITKTQEEHQSEEAKNKESKELETSFQEIKDLNKPDIEEARDFDASLKNGSIIMIGRNSSQEHEVYNIASLDRFIDSFNNGKEDYVRVIKGIIESDGTFLVNKLEEHETDGKVIKSLVYDTYADKNKFILGRPSYSYKMIKSCSDNGIRYSVLLSKDTPEEMGATVISLDKSSIKN